MALKTYLTLIAKRNKKDKIITSIISVMIKKNNMLIVKGRTVGIFVFSVQSVCTYEENNDVRRQENVNVIFNNFISAEAQHTTCLQVFVSV